MFYWGLEHQTDKYGSKEKTWRDMVKSGELAVKGHTGFGELR
jgi:hypothetical protein